MDSFPLEDREYARALDLSRRKQRGWVHEVEVPMREAESFDFATEHDGPGGRIEFNVHSHQGAQVRYHIEESEARLAGRFTAPWEGKFYLMWENVSDVPVRVRIRATRQLG